MRPRKLNQPAGSSGTSKMADSQQSLRYVDPRESTLSSASEPELVEIDPNISGDDAGIIEKSSRCP
jgi:hypothetical protein